MLTRLIYASRAVENVGIGDVRAIIDSASRNNLIEGVTGMLCFDRIYFFQCLEGGRAAVNRIFSKIVSDSRHSEVTLIDYANVERRLFTSWSMAYVSAQEDKIKTLIKNYSLNDAFKPFDLNGQQATNLIFDLSQSLNSHFNVKILDQ